MNQRQLLIIWDSRTGASKQLARAAEAGARTALLELRSAAVSANAESDDDRNGAVGIIRVHASRAHAQSMCAAKAYLFVAPENLASMSGVMKAFFDRTYYDVIDRVAGRPYGIIIAAGSDGTGAGRQIERIAKGWRLRPVADPLIVITNAQTAAAIASPKRVPATALARAAELGGALASGLAMGIF